MESKMFLKRCTSPEAVFAEGWYNSVPEAHRPKEVYTRNVWSKPDEAVLCMTCYAHPARSLQHVWDTARAALWRDTDRKRFMKHLAPPTYAGYICNIAERTLNDDEYRQVQRFMAMLCTQRFTRVTACHGDLTMDNVMLDATLPTSNVIFIDPGYDRCLPCRELDEAKLLQSVEGWHNFRLYGKLPFKVKYVHKLLLLTHYIRLYAHPEKHSTHWLQWARNRIDHMLFSPLGGLLKP